MLMCVIVMVMQYDIITGSESQVSLSDVPVR